MTADPSTDRKGSPMRSVLTGFKEFILRGNVIELAVAVVIGAAFTALINSLVTGLFNPLIALIFGKSDLTKVWAFTIGSDPGTPFYPGIVLDALVKFLVIAAIVYLIIVLPLNTIAERRKRGVEPAPDAVPADTLLLQEIRDLLSAQQGAGPSTPSTDQDSRPRH